MMKRTLLLACTLVCAGCYNDPEITRKFPGEGKTDHMSGPAVGPGTTPGGATAGPQPEPREHKKTGTEQQHGPGQVDAKQNPPGSHTPETKAPAAAPPHH